MADRPIIVNNSSGAASVFWGLFLFFIVMPFVVTLGCFVCSGTLMVGAAKISADAIEEQKKLEQQNAQAQAVRQSQQAQPGFRRPAAEPNSPAPIVREQKPARIEPSSRMIDEPQKATTAPLATVPQEPPKRKLKAWKNSTGQLIAEADFAGYSSGVVKLKKSDGSIVSIQMIELSDDDQAFITSKKKK